jgi:hypothetical protein
VLLGFFASCLVTLVSCCFMRAQELLVNAYTMPAWQAAVNEYERAMRPVEAVVAGKLRTHISGAVDRPQQLLREFAKFVRVAAACGFCAPC